MKTFLKIVPFLAFAAFQFDSNAALEKFVLDPNHTNITWQANHLGFSNPDGKFAKSEGVIMFDEQDPKASSVNVTIDTRSIVTGLPTFDKHLKSEDFFNVKKFKTATFESTKVVVGKNKTAKIHGNLTMLGITKPVVLDAIFNKAGEHPWTKKKTVGFSATTVIKRSEFGMNYGIGMVSDDVNLRIEVEASVE